MNTKQLTKLIELLVVKTIKNSDMVKKLVKEEVNKQLNILLEIETSKSKTVKQKTYKTNHKPNVSLRDSIFSESEGFEKIGSDKFNINTQNNVNIKPKQLNSINDLLAQQTNEDFKGLGEHEVPNPLKDVNRNNKLPEHLLKAFNKNYSEVLEKANVYSKNRKGMMI